MVGWRHVLAFRLARKRRPATAPYPGSAPGYDYCGELAALTDPLAKKLIARDGVTLGRFADFV